MLEAGRAHQLAHVGELTTLIRADQHELVRPLRPCELGDRIHERRVVLVRPKLSRIKEIASANAERLDTSPRKGFSLRCLAGESRRGMPETDDARGLDPKVSNDLVTARTVGNDDTGRFSDEPAEVAVSSFPCAAGAHLGKPRLTRMFDVEHREDVRQLGSLGVRRREPDDVDLIFLERSLEPRSWTTVRKPELIEEVSPLAYRGAPYGGAPRARNRADVARPASHVRCVVDELMARTRCAPAQRDEETLSNGVLTALGRRRGC